MSERSIKDSGARFDLWPMEKVGKERSQGSPLFEVVQVSEIFCCCCWEGRAAVYYVFSLDTNQATKK